MTHPDEVVQPEEEVESEVISEAVLRHENADSDMATPQEKKQAAVEQAHALSTRPDGSYAQLHETEEPTVAVADDKRVEQLKKEQKAAEDKLAGKTDSATPKSGSAQASSTTATPKAAGK